MAIDERVACRKALADYIRNGIPGVVDGITATYPSALVEEAWPTGANFTDPTITVVVPEVAPKVREYQPSVHRVTPTAGVQGTVLYSYGLADFGLQLDVWTQYTTTRDELNAALRDIIGQPAFVTLGGDTKGSDYTKGQSPLSLVVPDLYSIVASFSFDHFPQLSESSQAVQTGSSMMRWPCMVQCRLVDQITAALVQTQVRTVKGSPG